MIQFFARNFRRSYRIPAIIFYLFARGTAALWAFRKKDKNDRCRSARIVTAQTQLWARGLLRLLGVHYTLDGDLKKVDAEGGLLHQCHGNRKVIHGYPLFLNFWDLSNRADHPKALDD